MYQNPISVKKNLLLQKWSRKVSQGRPRPMGPWPCWGLFYLRFQLELSRSPRVPMPFCSAAGLLWTLPGSTLHITGMRGEVRGLGRGCHRLLSHVQFPTSMVSLLCSAYCLVLYPLCTTVSQQVCFPCTVWWDYFLRLRISWLEEVRFGHDDSLLRLLVIVSGYYFIPNVYLVFTEKLYNRMVMTQQCFRIKFKQAQIILWFILCK